MILFHPYSIDPKHRSRQNETWEALQKIDPLLDSRWKLIVHTPCAANKEDVSDYERGLLGLWGTDDLVIVEHDIIPVLDMLIGLADCPHPLCAQAYRLWINQADLPVLFELYRSGVELPHPWDEIAPQFLYLNTLPGTWILAHRVQTPGAEWKWRCIEDGEEWADYAGFGLTKISLDFQRKHPPEWESGPWYNLDSRVSEWTIELGYKWHVHYPEAEHNHREIEGSI